MIFNRKDGKGTPPLVAAVQHGHIDICHLLIDGGSDINAYDSKLQRNALQYAVIAKRFDLFELVLKHKPKLDHCDHKGRTIFHRVCAIQEPKYLKKLFHSGFSITTSLMDQETDDGLTPVIISCQNGNAEQLKELLENGASVRTTDKTGKNALHYCADNLETQCAEMLLMREESLLHVQDEQGFTPLHMAVIGGNVPLLKLLVRKGADVDILDADGHTPSHWATVCTHLEILDVLIEQDAELSKCDNHNAYPIHYAAQMNGRDNGHSDAKIGEKVLKKLLDSGIPCDVLDKDRRQPLLWAASAGNSESCKLLVTAGADVNSTDKDGLTALHCAASRGHSDCVDKLKKLGAEVNVADTNGCTALFYAITLGNKECTRLLLKYGADPNHKDTRGRTPTHCAAIKGCLETVKMLDKSKADLWHPSFRGDCPIHEAAQGGHCDVVKYLLKWKNSPEAVNIANDAGRTCLHIAAIVNNLQLCKLLLDSDADKNALMKNKDKSYTPYDAAIIKGNNEIAEYIKSKGGVTGGDIDNILIAKGKKRDTKSGNSRKSQPTLETTPEETEPDDNKKAEEEAEKEKDEEDKKKQDTEEDKKKQKSEVDKKKDKGKKKEKVEKEREKEKLVIVPVGKQKKKEKDEKGKEDQKESEKEKAETDQEGKGEKKDLTDEELRELQEKIKAGESEVDERDIKRKPIKEIEGRKTEGEQQKKDNETKDKDKIKDLTEEELEEARRKIQAGQGDLDERERKQKEAEKEKSPKKEDQETKGKKKDLSDEELKALQEKIKAEQGDNDERGKNQKPKKEDREKGGKQKPDLTDAEVAAVTAAVIVATEEDKKKSDRDKEKEKLKTKEKDKDKQKGKDQGKGKDNVKSADQGKERKKETDREELDIPPPSTSPDLREPKQKEKSNVDKGQKDKKKQLEESKKKQIEENKKKQIEESKKKQEKDEKDKKKLRDEIESEERKRKQEQDQRDKKRQTEKSENNLSEESDIEDSKKKQADELDSEEYKKKQEKDKRVHIVPKSAFVDSATASESERSRRDSPVKYRQRSRSRSTDNEEFEFPEGAHETTEAAIAAAEARRKARERSRSRSTDRESDEKPADLRRYSKVGTDGRIQPGLLADKDKRNRRSDERDIPSPLDSEDEFIDDPYFGRRVKPYPGSLRIGSKRPDNREQVLREKELSRKRQQEMSRSSQRMPSKGGVARMLPLGYSRLETPQRPITRKSNSIQESVRRYQTERTFVRQLHQLKRAQIYTGPMHDIVLFSKMMNVYNNTSNYDNELDLDSQVLDDWDGYLQDDRSTTMTCRSFKSSVTAYSNYNYSQRDQLRFVSHYYEDDRTGLRDTAKEYHQKLEKSATNAKKTVESRIDHIIKQNEKQEVVEREEQEKLDKKISHLAEKTESVLDSVRQQANESVTSARNLNSSLEEEFRRERQDRLKNYRYGNNREKSWLLEQEAMDSRQSRMDENEKERKAKHKEWMRKKDEESRKKLMRVYGPTPVFDTSVSKRGAPFKTSTPKLMNNSTRASPRPKSMASSMSTSRSRPQDQELEVHMTEFGMRRVKTDDYSFANWTPKYDGINLRPRAGLVFVEPTVYDEVLKEERLLRGGQTRNSTRNLTLETDKMLETVES